MRCALIPLALGLGAHFVTAGWFTECYNFNVTGHDIKGHLALYTYGEIRIHEHVPPLCFCFTGSSSTDGLVTDTFGKGCNFVPFTGQFWCSRDGSRTITLSLTREYPHTVLHKGDENFYACLDKYLNAWNVYLKPIQNPTRKCRKIQIQAFGPCAIPPVAWPLLSRPPPLLSRPPPPLFKPIFCPADLKGDYLYPSLMIPVDLSRPDVAGGTRPNVIIDNHTCTIFTFDVPSPYAGKKCTAIFIMPENKDLRTPYTMSGHSHAKVYRLAGAAGKSTTMRNKPGTVDDATTFHPRPGSWPVDAMIDCPAGESISYEMCATGDFEFEYIQDNGANPIGMYMRQC